jgi:hypothetical protein
MDIEYLLNILTVVSLLVGGLIFIYQGYYYIDMRKQNDKLPTKLLVAGILTIILGFVSIIFGILHYYFWMYSNKN